MGRLDYNYPRLLCYNMQQCGQFQPTPKVIALVFVDLPPTTTNKVNDDDLYMPLSRNHLHGTLSACKSIHRSSNDVHVMQESWWKLSSCQQHVNMIPY